MTANVTYSPLFNKGDFCETHTRSGSRGRLGRSPPLKPATVTLFTISFYNSENTSLKECHCAVTAVLWSIQHLSYISEAVMRFYCQITEIAPRSCTGWIRTWLTLPIGRLWLALLAVQTDNLSGKLPTQTPPPTALPASRRSFSDTTTSCRKTAVVLKLSNVSYAEFSLQSPKFNVDKTIQWLEYSFLLLVENIPLNIKKKNEICQQMFFILLVTAIKGRTTPEIRLLPGVVKVNAIAQGALQRFTQWLLIENQPSNWGGGHCTTGLLPPQQNVGR